MLCTAAHTYKQPPDRLRNFSQIDRVVSCVKLQSLGWDQPRLEDEIAGLFVERKPRDVHWTVSHGQFISRFPVAPAVGRDHHVVRLRSYFVVLHHFRAVVDTNGSRSAVSVKVKVKVKVKEADLYSAFIEVPYIQGAQVRITQCYMQIIPYLPLPRKHSPDGASQTEVADI